MEHWFKAVESQIWSANTKAFPWESEANLSLVIFEIPLNIFWSLSRTYIESSEWYNIGLWNYNAKFGRRIQNHSSGKATKILEFLRKFFRIFELCIICFQVYENTKSNPFGHGTFAQGFGMPNLVDEYKTSFLGKQDKSWNSR